MTLSLSAARGDICRSVMWGFRENSSRKLTPLEVLSICPSPFLPSCCPDGCSSNSFPKSWVTLGWRPCDRTVEQKGRRRLGPCHPRHVRASLDFFYIKKITFLFMCPLFGFSAICSHLYSSLLQWGQQLLRGKIKAVKGL